jgi:hypothetical protein
VGFGHTGFDRGGMGLAKFEGWQQALAEAVAEGGGSVRVRLFDVEETLALLDEVRHHAAGSSELRDLSAVAELLHAARIPRQRAARCLLCRKPLGGRRQVVAACMLLRAARDDPGEIFAFGLCAPCVHTAGGHRQLWPAIVPILKAAEPGLRDISVQIVADLVGHA